MFQFARRLFYLMFLLGFSLEKFKGIFFVKIFPNFSHFYAAQTNQLNSSLHTLNYFLEKKEKKKF